MFAKSPSSPDPLSPRLSHHRTATAGDQPRRPGSWQSIPVSARSATAPGTPASPMSPLSPRIGSKGLPMQPTPVTPDPLLASPGFTVDDWAHTQGVSPEELQALQLAGLDPAAPDTFEHWPLPDDTGRSVPGLPTAPRSGMAPPSGWTELSVRSTSGSVQHYRFMPITVPRDLRRLRQGLLMAELASALGAPGVMPAVHACFHRVDGVLTYGMLLPFDPYAPSAADAGLNPQRPGLVSQCVALDWLGFLMGQRIEPDDLVWEPQGNGLQLRLKLPPETVLASGLNTGSGPGHPGVIERDMLTRLARTDPAHWGREASSVLGDSAGDGLRQRLEWARSLNDSMVQVIGPASQRESTGLLQQLGGDDIAELLEKVKAGKITIEAARQQARHESMAARIVLEHGLQVAAARRSDPQEITSPQAQALDKAINAYDKASVQEKKPATLQQPQVAQALRSLLDQLQEEQRLLAPLCKSGRIKELKYLGVEIPTNSRLVEMMATSELKKDLFNAWTDAGLDVRDLARGGLGDLALEDLDSAVPDGLSSPGAVAGARHVLAARMSFPHMDKARFLALAPVLLERQVPLELLQCMADWAIEPNPDNLPGASDLLQATECDLKPLGKGNMGTAYKLQLGSQWWVFKAEQEGGPGDAAQADIPARGANTTGRVLAAARMARLLQLDTIPEARPFWVPPRDGMPGRYGSVSRLVTGSMLQAGAGDVAVYPLDNDFKVMGARKQMPQIKDRARQHGFEDVHLDENKRQLVFKPRTEYLRPLDHASLALRRSLAEANVTELITGQVDGNPGNYLLENGQQARLIDTAESFLPNLSHPLGQITKPAPVIKEWETHLQAMVSAVSRNQPLPKTPGSVGMVQRLELLRLSEGEFVQRWARGLSQGDQQMAWLAMQSLQAQLNNKDGITSVPDRVAIDGNTTVHCHGWPPAVASDLKAAVLALTEGSVAQALAPFLKPEEVQSTWSRTLALQNMLQVPGAIHEVRSDDQWLSAEVTQRMGWTPSALKTAQEKLDGAPGDDWEKRAFKRDLLMDSGLPGALALEEHLMRKAIGRSTPDAPYQGTALFDPKSLLEGMNLA